MQLFIGTLLIHVHPSRKRKISHYTTCGHHESNRGRVPQVNKAHDNYLFVLLIDSTSCQIIHLNFICLFLKFFKWFQEKGFSIALQWAFSQVIRNSGGRRILSSQNAVCHEKHVFGPTGCTVGFNLGLASKLPASGNHQHVSEDETGLTGPQEMGWRPDGAYLPSTACWEAQEMNAVFPCSGSAPQENQPVVTSKHSTDEGPSMLA